MLRSEFLTAEQVAAVAAGDYRGAGLDTAEAAICAFAEAVVLRANEVTQADIDALRTHGLDDGEVFDIVLAATAWPFWSRANDAIGYEAPAWWVRRTRAAFGDDICRALTVGRPFEQAGDTPALESGAS